MSKFHVAAILFSFLLLAGIICFGFKSMNSLKDGNSLVPTLSTIENYGRRAMATIKSVTYPVLEQLGIDTRIDPRDTVKHELEKASSTLNEATKSLTQ